MTYLLDTATVSEWVKPRPDPGVVRWLDELAVWLDDQLAERFDGRLLPVGREVADAWGRLTARLERRGRKVCTVDTLIAATAEHHRLRVVTRNEADFEPTGVTVINPWTS